jgi:hypothetical protein
VVKCRCEFHKRPRYFEMAGSTVYARPLVPGKESFLFQVQISMLESEICSSVEHGRFYSIAAIADWLRG